MPSTKLRFRVSAVRGFAAAGIMAGALGLTAGGLQAAPESPADRGVADFAPRDMPGSCGAGERGLKRFELERAGGETHTIDICDKQERRDLSATAEDALLPRKSGDRRSADDLRSS